MRIRYGTYIKSKKYHFINDNNLYLTWNVEDAILSQIDLIEKNILDAIGSESLSLKELYLKLSKKLPKKIIKKSVSTLIDVNLLTYATFSRFDNIENIQNEEKNFLKLVERASLQHIFLNVAQDCNMDCRYCYASGGTYNQEIISPSLISKKVAKQAVNFLISSSGDRDAVRITFFGGEPLLNMPVIKWTIDYGNKVAKENNKKIYFGITTNGTLLNNEIIDYLLKQNVEITVSIDGPKNIHDLNRIYKGKKNGTYNTVYKNISRLLSNAKKYDGFIFFRATVTAEGLRHFKSIIEQLIDLGGYRFHLDFATYKSSDEPNWGKPPTKDDFIAFRQQLRLMADDILKAAINGKKSKFLPAFTRLLGVIEKRTKKNRFCSTIGNRFCGVSTSGQLYLCHRFVGTKIGYIGDIWNGINKEIHQKVKKIHIFNSPICSICWIRHICGGNCPQENYYFCNNFVLQSGEPVQCRAVKIWFEEALILYARLVLNNLKIA